MSEARKCDRCHEFYEIKPAVRNCIVIGERTFIGTSGKSYILCPNCIELLDKWLENSDNYDPHDLVRNINDAEIYITQLKNEPVHNFTDEDIYEEVKIND